MTFFNEYGFHRPQIISHAVLNNVIIRWVVFTR